jgi:hypothetical protein
MLRVLFIFSKNLRNIFPSARFQVLTAASMKMAVIWDVAPCSLIEVTKFLEVLTASIIIAAIKPVS